MVINALSIDGVEGHTVSITREGIEITRPFKITELTGLASNKITTVLTHGSMPDVGDPHVEFAQAILEQIEFAFVATDAVEGKLTYRQPPGPETGYEIEVGTTLEDVTVYEDINGNAMAVYYKGREQRVNFTVGRPRSTITFTTHEATSPAAKSRAFTGKVNQAGWDWDPGAAARTWRCNSITGRITTADEYWTVTTSCEYAGETWDHTGSYQDEDTGRLPDDYVPAIHNLAVKKFQVYEEADFDAMGLPAPP